MRLNWVALKEVWKKSIHTAVLIRNSLIIFIDIYMVLFFYLIKWLQVFSDSQIVSLSVTIKKIASFLSKSF